LNSKTLENLKADFLFEFLEERAANAMKKSSKIYFLGMVHKIYHRFVTR